METDELRAASDSGSVASDETVDWARVFADHLPRVHNFFSFPNRHILGRIARNVATDHLRSIRRHLPLEAACNVPSDASSETDALQGSDIKRPLRLMAELPEHQRELIALKYGGALNNRLRIVWVKYRHDPRVHVGKLRSRW